MTRYHVATHVWAPWHYLTHPPNDTCQALMGPHMPHLPSQQAKPMAHHCMVNFHVSPPDDATSVLTY
jgi:hypothetical protein